MVDEFDAKVGLERLRCVHVNDSKVPLGANRDHHANLGKGELGRQGLRVFLSEPRFEELPALIETPGPDGRGPDRNEVRTAKRLRRDGLRRSRQGWNQARASGQGVAQVEGGVAAVPGVEEGPG